TSSKYGIWVGLDGNDLAVSAPPGHLVQAGMAMENLDVGGTFFNSQPYAWFEYIYDPDHPSPQQAQQIVTDLPIHPGDDFHVDVVVVNQDRTPNPAGPLVLFSFDNYTTGGHTAHTLLRGQTIIEGSTAEWIIEQTRYQDGTYEPLADYGSFTISGPLALHTTH